MGMLLDTGSMLYPWGKKQPCSILPRELMISCPGYGNNLSSPTRNISLSLASFPPPLYGGIGEAKHVPAVSTGPPTPVKSK